MTPLFLSEAEEGEAVDQSIAERDNSTTAITTGGGHGANWGNVM
jgi:hypothetical protein